jgi:hypothetical protein
MIAFPHFRTASGAQPPQIIQRPIATLCDQRPTTNDQLTFDLHACLLPLDSRPSTVDGLDRSVDLPLDPDTSLTTSTPILLPSFGSSLSAHLFSLFIPSAPLAVNGTTPRPTRRQSGAQLSRLPPPQSPLSHARL